MHSEWLHGKGGIPTCYFKWHEIKYRTYKYNGLKQPQPEDPMQWASQGLRKESIFVYIYIYVIVIAQLSGIYGSKPTESEGDSPRTRFVYVAINPWQLCYKYYISLEAVEQRTWFVGTATYLIGPPHSLGYEGWLPTSYLHSTFVTKKWPLCTESKVCFLCRFTAEVQGVNTEPRPQSLNASAILI